MTPPLLPGAVSPHVAPVVEDALTDWDPGEPGTWDLRRVPDLRRVLETLNERHRSVYDVLADEYEEKSSKHIHTTQDRVNRVIECSPGSFLPGSTVLDVGCGVGLALSMLSSSGLQATGVDISPRMAGLARDRVAEAADGQTYRAEVVVGDFLTVDLQTTYDAIWEQALLHLFPSVLQGCIFERFRALLSPGGILSLSTTVSNVSWEDWETKADYGAAPPRYRRSMTGDELVGALQLYGFDLVETWVTTDPFRKNWRTVVGKKR